MHFRNLMLDSNIMLNWNTQFETHSTFQEPSTGFQPVLYFKQCKNCSHIQSPFLNSYLYCSWHRRDIPILDMLAEVITDGSKRWMDFHTKFAFVANHLPLLKFWNIFQVSKSLFEYTSITHWSMLCYLIFRNTDQILHLKGNYAWSTHILFGRIARSIFVDIH